VKQLGEIVHYVGHLGGCRAAIVTNIKGFPPGGVSLSVFMDREENPILYKPYVSFAGGLYMANTWHYPEDCKVTYTNQDSIKPESSI
jgi:hypothetical protein